MLEVLEARRVSGFEDLDVWRRAFDISLVVHKKSLTFPHIEQYALGDQIRRASKSICANIAEGFPKQRVSKLEFKRYLMMSLASANEMLTWVKFCKALEYINDDEFKVWHEEYSSICKMLNALHIRS